MDDGLRIRLAEPADLVAVRSCVEAAYALYLDRMDKPPAPVLDDYGDLIARGVVRLADLDGSVVGVLVLWPEADHLYVDNVAVAPGQQGRGIGAALLTRAEDEARTAGRTEIRLYTNEAMVENISYYPRRGFVETHRGTEAGYRRIYYARPVPPAADATP